MALIKRHRFVQFFPIIYLGSVLLSADLCKFDCQPLSSFDKFLMSGFFRF
ncbi:hypothetical protein AWRIB429_1222 [Oenococcus oeni AWRIB429]|uniref:Uncharacterized protein n=1 Tax=Oenococcus oeni AWRIB429 TaxID=655225 RepID=D3LA42_OENOE|nr:hypothetical protein AWRIB429_1222 [Oenococcus oeni AWRIB429]